MHIMYMQCCSCHATQVDGILPGRSNRQQSPAEPVNMRHNMRRCSLKVGAAKVIFGWKLWQYILAYVNHSPARNKKTTTALCRPTCTQYAHPYSVHAPTGCLLRAIRGDAYVFINNNVVLLVFKNN